MDLLNLFIYTYFKRPNKTNIKFPFQYVLLNFSFLVREIGYDTLKIEHLYEAYQLHVNMIFSIKYQLFKHNQLIKAYKYYNSFFELIFQITSISL